jgi:predicted metalloprotease with PDZ domain
VKIDARPLALACALHVAGACSPASPAPPRAAISPACTTAGPSAPPATSIASAPAAPREQPDVDVVIRPALAPAAHVHVEETFSKIVAAPFVLAHGTSADIGAMSVEDANGTVAHSLRERDGGVVLELARPLAPPLHIRFDVRASQDPRASSREVVVLDDRFRAVGESLLFVPKEGDRALLRVTVDGAGISAAGAATSFGVGKTRERRARPSALQASAFMAGALGTAVFDAGADHDEAAWLGYTAFDPRPVSAELASTRTLVHEAFRGESEDFTTLFLVQPRPRGVPALVPRASSAMLLTSADDAWNADTRILTTRLFVSRYLGGELRFKAPNDGAIDATAWFDSGVCLYVAAHVLAHAGLLPPDDAAKLVRGLLATDATSIYRDRPRAETAAAAARDPAAHAFMTAHGALYALRTAKLLERTKGARTLYGVLIDLLENARKSTAPLDESLFVSSLVAELSGAEVKAFADVIDAGHAASLPDDALGPCFAQQKTRHAAFVLGFDLERTLDGTERTIAGLAPDGPAARAGLQAKDVLVDASVKADDPNANVVLTVKRNGETRTVTYAPRGAEHAGMTFVRRPGRADTQCGEVL